VDRRGGQVVKGVGLLELARDEHEILDADIFDIGIRHGRFAAAEIEFEAVFEIGEGGAVHADAGAADVGTAVEIIATFLDVGGGANKEKVTEAFKIMLKNPKVKAIMVNIFGGIMKCDTIATGVITACKATNLGVPLVVRMKGTNEELGKQMLKDSGLPIISADTMAEAAQKVVAAVTA